MNRIIFSGAVFTALAVMLGAFGAHGLKNYLDATQMAVYQTAVQYHFYHALGLILIGVSAIRGKVALYAAISIGIGILLFSGSLYLMTLTGTRWLGIITPFGGTAFILGWIMFAYAAIKKA
jgi:uncharacterized membrane protein YgdD (TMEM256/DUF423 family)